MNPKVNLLKKLGFDSLTEIQQIVFQSNKIHNELVLYAPTGSGKTLTFLVSVLDKMNETTINSPQTIILSPTRELAIQIEKVFKSLKTNYSVTTCYGGHAIKTEINNLAANPAVIIGTPGRIADLLKRGYIQLKSTSNLIIDEFDKCLELGFLSEIEQIYHQLHQLKYSIYCSATKMENFPSFIQLTKPVYFEVARPTNTNQTFYKLANGKGKLEMLTQLINGFQSEPTILFCNFRDDVDALKAYFDDLDIVCTSFHGGMEQEERERSLLKFKNGSAPLLICTDLGARGIDISGIQHIVHYQLPREEASFIHRNGRTARMNESGAIYFFEDAFETVDYDLPKSNLFKLSNKQYQEPKWVTIYFSGGKKNKINKIDLLGFICQKGNVTKEQIGMITVMDFQSYVAIDRTIVSQLLPELRKHKIKGQKVRIAISL
ncbi:MAG: DEAD/DEAH box helicase [Crocinitomicaceae bacterium]|nr:DEAD/DEAH box helicase [Crocinitomicaceae bacterium]